jgi:hypothetical protein
VEGGTDCESWTGNGDLSLPSLPMYGYSKSSTDRLWTRGEALRTSALVRPRTPERTRRTKKTTAHSSKVTTSASLGSSVVNFCPEKGRRRLVRQSPGRPSARSNRTVFIRACRDIPAGEVASFEICERDPALLWALVAGSCYVAFQRRTATLRRQPAQTHLVPSSQLERPLFLVS